MAQCQSSAAMHELQSLCRHAARRMQSQAGSGEACTNSSRAWGRSSRGTKQRTVVQQPAHPHQQGQAQQQQIQQQQQQLHQLQPLWQQLQPAATPAAQLWRTSCRSRLGLLVQQPHSNILQAFRPQNRLLSRAAAGSPPSFSTLAAARAAGGSSRLGLSQRLGSSSSSSWRSWVQQQLGSSRMLHLQRQIRPQAAAAAAHATRGLSSSAAVAAAASRSSAQQLSAGWADTWSLWVDKTSGFLLASLLNALNLVGNKLPVALGLLLVDMAHNSPLLGGSRADSLQAAYLPANLTEGGFYSDGGAVYAATAAAAAAEAGRKDSSSQQQGAWAGVAAALSAGARLLWLGCIWLPALVTSPAALWGGAAARAWWLVLLRLSLEASGPAFIKWGQWAATRHDVFAQDVCSALEQLHTAAPAHGFRWGFRV